ncbi:hypothetical protein EZV62_014522 [Acer yangbiense]|uniref:Uncharacterized protein n=1 Tax=Acer yangbiense TaxID=1000413 RepID=A0A5C7HT76_9ROSI|nr:hypothetical protein EZV62_014522 [Acer yangbiense]
MAAPSHEQNLSIINYSKWVCLQMVYLLILSRLVASFSTVRYLPGFSGSLPFKLETGYIGVDENEDVQLFYYFVESEGNPREDPLLIWLTGGPGCSSFFGLVTEIGPLHFNNVEYNGSLPTLRLSPHSWTKVASIIFLDAPATTGFSYSRSLQGSKSSDIKYADQSYEFLRKWLLSHPKFIGNPFYVAGDSYTGIIAPIIAHKISTGIELGHKPPINLKGYGLGNPETDPKYDVNSEVPYAHRMALISDELYKSAKRNCNGEYVEVDNRNVQCAKDLRAISECTNGLNRQHILEPLCPSNDNDINKMNAGYHRSVLEKYNEPLLSMANISKFGCRNYKDFLLKIWENDINVHKALHVRKGTFKAWVLCDYNILNVKYVKSVLSYHLHLNSRGYRALIYSGDHDMLQPYLGTLSWIKALNFTVIDDWRPWLVDDQVAGYSTEYSNNFTFATVKASIGQNADEESAVTSENPSEIPELILVVYFFQCNQLAFMVLLVILSRLASSFSTVKYLPGFSGSLPFKLETGYIGVDENEDAQLFYYFIESEGNPIEDPLLLWLTGGPGCTSLTGLLEIGPLHFNLVEYNGSLPTLRLHPPSWTKVASIIFLDAPVDTGFSYSGLLQAKRSIIIILAGLHSGCSAIQNLLEIHSMLLVTHILASLFQSLLIKYHRVILFSPFSFPQLLCGLKQITRLIMIDATETDPKFDVNSQVPYAHRMALISDELYKSAKRNCRGEYVQVDHRNVQCAKDLQAISKCTNRLNHQHILKPFCPSMYNHINKMDANIYHRSMLEKYNEPLLSKANRTKFECMHFDTNIMDAWGNDINVHKALHVRKGKFKAWSTCYYNIPYERYVKSVLSYHLHLNNRGYRALIYSGDHDMLQPYMGTLSWIKALNFTVIDNWRPWLVDDQVAGYSTEYSNNFTFATVKARSGSYSSRLQAEGMLCHVQKWKERLIFKPFSGLQVYEQLTMAASSHEQSLSMINYSNWVCLQMVLLVILLRLAASFSTVKYLPGFSGSLPFKLETGYIGVDENEDAQLFYYFIESERNPREDPLLLWLTGGPGCSALSGLVFEIGPLHFNIVEYNGSLPTFKLHPHSWTKVASIIFLDAPVGTGFSYSRCLQGSKSSDIKYANHSYEFLRKWLLSHPKFIGNPFYVAGDSYSGMIVPVIAHEISAGVELDHKPPINLKGYMLGNPFTDAKFDVNSRVPFAHRVALISDELYKSAKRNCKGEYIEVDSRNVQCAKDLKAISECTDKVNGAHILEPLCRSSGVNVNKMDAGYHRSMLEKYNDTLLSMANSPKFGCRNYNNFLCNIWGNDIDAQKALHVRKGTFTEWVRCNKSILDEYYVNSTLSYHLRLNNRGYRALIYSGDHDKIIPYLGTLSWIKTLNFTVIDDWRPWLVDDQVAGYIVLRLHKYTSLTTQSGLEGVIQLQSTSQGNALLCSKGGYLMNHCDDHFLVTPQDCLYGYSIENSEKINK